MKIIIEMTEAEASEYFDWKNGRKTYRQAGEEPIGDGLVGLDARSLNALKGASLNTMSELCSIRQSDLLKISNLGKISYRLICDEMKSAGFGFETANVGKLSGIGDTLHFTRDN